MKLSGAEREALHEYVEGRLASGSQWHAIAADLEAYTRGDDAKLTEAELDGLPELHRAWKRRRAFVEKQRQRGDRRAGTGGIAEVEVDWHAADEGAVKLDLLTEDRLPSLLQRAEALRAVMYLKRALLKARWKWVFFKNVSVPTGMTYEVCKKPGREKLADGTEAEWVSGAVITRRADGVACEVYEECRIRRPRPAGWTGCRTARLDLERRELIGEMIDMRDISARLAALMHVCLGGERSPFRNNEHLASLLGVSREAMRVRKKNIMREAGIRSAVGMAPNRAAGGRACQRNRKAAAQTNTDK